jgi:hypothetical protein
VGRSDDRVSGTVLLQQTTPSRGFSRAFEGSSPFRDPLRSPRAAGPGSADPRTFHTRLTPGRCPGVPS